MARRELVEYLYLAASYDAEFTMHNVPDVRSPNQPSLVQRRGLCRVNVNLTLKRL